jgi:hypothetical protein
MPEPAADTPPSPKKRGPRTPEGKARSAQNARRHGLRARRFTFVPGDDPTAFEALCHDLRCAYAPEDRAEAELVEAIAAGMWQAARADRMEAETLTAMARDGQPPHGADLLAATGPRAGLATVLRYQAAAGGAVRRAFDLLLKHKKARRDGLLPPLAETATPPAANTNRPPPALLPLPAPAPADTNDFAPPESTGAPAPGATIPSGANEWSPPVWATRGEPPAAPEARTPPPAAPVFRDPDPAREAKRQAILAGLAPPILRTRLAHCALELLEQHQAACDPDPSVYEAWFARQPKPARVAVELSEEDKAAIRAVTRHNPPWARGEHLGCWREPVPKEAFLDDAGRFRLRPERPPEGAEAAVAAPAESATALLRRRVARLLDRTAPRQADELDLAEAICAVKWPKWPAYTGAVDLVVLRRVLQGVALDAATLHRLGSHELARACRAGRPG